MRITFCITPTVLGVWRLRLLWAHTIVIYIVYGFIFSCLYVHIISMERRCAILSLCFVLRLFKHGKVMKMYEHGDLRRLTYPTAHYINITNSNSSCGPFF